MTRQEARRHTDAIKDALVERDRILGTENAELSVLRAEVGRLRRVIRNARDMLASWGAYADDYFQRKHGLADDLATLDAVIDEELDCRASHDIQTVWIASSHRAHEGDSIEGIYLSQSAAVAALRRKFPSLRPTDPDECTGAQFEYDQGWHPLLGPMVGYADVRRSDVHV